jgi:UDP-N-acetylglucosamine 2-epimerase (non-hydrolysing)
MKVAIVLGTRPEIIRLSKVIERLDAAGELVLIHTGQNFDPALSDVFFDELGVRTPDHPLAIEGEGFAARVGAILAAAQTVFERERPDRLLVLGDTDSAMSAYVAKRMGIPVLHMEAGNRCFDDRVPEEVNRRIIDQASDVLLPYTERSRENLLREGYHPSRVLTIGNPIKEILDAHAERIDASTALDELELAAGEYLLLTLHRQETVDFEQRLRTLLAEVGEAADELGLPVVFSVHPRTRERLERLGLDRPPLRPCEPFGYFDFVALERGARCVLTDSGTVQEECCLMRVPSVTLRDSTERPETVECGSNVLSGVGVGGVAGALRLACERPTDWRIPPEYEAENVSSVVAGIVGGHLPGA